MKANNESVPPVALIDSWLLLPNAAVPAVLITPAPRQALQPAEPVRMQSSKSSPRVQHSKTFLTCIHLHIRVL